MSWNTLHNYYRDSGIPHRVIRDFSILPTQAQQIQSIIERTQPRAILEIGTFIGMSTGVFALSTNCPIVSVDPDLPVELLTSLVNWHDGRTAHVFLREMLEHFGKTEQVHVLKGCFSCVTSSYKDLFLQNGGDPRYLQGYQSPIVGEQARKYGPYDLVFLDGDHSTEAVYKDLTLALSMLSERGIFILHNVAEGRWSRDVTQGIEQFLHEHPEFFLQVDGEMGFVSRDREKTWLTPVQRTLVEHARHLVHSIRSTKN